MQFADFKKQSAQERIATDQLQKDKLKEIEALKNTYDNKLKQTEQQFENWKLENKQSRRGSPSDKLKIWNSENLKICRASRGDQGGDENRKICKYGKHVNEFIETRDKK